uniref:Peroxidase n=1 Tax=Trichogramma kaykai TaxID=54128 RepID=A0ABD2WTZ2_9HYME
MPKIRDIFIRRILVLQLDDAVELDKRLAAAGTYAARPEASDERVDAALPRHGEVHHGHQDPIESRLAGLVSGRLPRDVARRRRSRGKGPATRDYGRDAGPGSANDAQRGQHSAAVRRHWLGTVNLCSGDYLSLIGECRKFDARYRSHSGRCNNPLYPARGAALEAYVRFLPANYSDGVSLPSPGMPSARLVSSVMHSGGADLKHPALMALTALFGEFVAHDLSHTPRMGLPNGERLKCCDVTYERFHPECMPIPAEHETGGCMEYARSAPHPGNSHQGCRLGQRQQMNQASSYLDLSPLYGSSEETSRLLRSGQGGFLNTQLRGLPMPANDTRNCRIESRAFPCFFSGDSRINEHPGLALMHLLFLREHNRIAENLQALNPHWDDERLYQESRRINIAEMQHVTYSEFLPLVLGEASVDAYDLRLTSRGHFRGYDTRVDATLSNAAASAGLFFVASLTPKTLDLVDIQSEKKSGERSLLSAFYAPQELYEAGAIDRLIAGATAGHSRKPEPASLNEVLVERYFHDGKTRERPVDYAAQMIQQGRDHGLPTYVQWRTFCGLPEVSTFADLKGTIAFDVIERLRGVYRKVQEIDLVTGALSEAPVTGSVLGPTFICLLGRTFRNARIEIIWRIALCTRSTISTYCFGRKNHQPRDYKCEFVQDFYSRLVAIEFISLRQ